MGTKNPQLLRNVFFLENFNQAAKKIYKILVQYRVSK